MLCIVIGEVISKSVNLGATAIAETKGYSFLYKHEKDGVKFQVFSCKKGKWKYYVFQMCKGYS